MATRRISMKASQRRSRATRYRLDPLAARLAFLQRCTWEVNCAYLNAQKQGAPGDVVIFLVDSNDPVGAWWLSSQAKPAPATRVGRHRTFFTAATSLGDAQRLLAKFAPLAVQEGMAAPVTPGHFVVCVIAFHGTTVKEVPLPAPELSQ